MRSAMLSLLLLSCLLVLAAPAVAQEDAGGPGYFVVALTLGSDDAESAEVLRAHVGHLNELYAQGVLFMAGPYFDDDHNGIAVVQASSAEEARSYFEQDPSVQAGLMQIASVHQWWTAFSRPDNEFFSLEEFDAMMQAHAAAGMPDDEAMSAGAADGAAMEAAEESGGEEGWIPVEGGIVHAELPSLNLEESAAFYSQVFGWQFINESPEYSLFMTPDPDGLAGGFTTKAPVDHGSYVYIYSADIEAKLEQIEAAGGSVFMAKTPVPGYGWFALFQDPHGNVVGLFSIVDPPPAAK